MTQQSNHSAHDLDVSEAAKSPEDEMLVGRVRDAVENTVTFPASVVITADDDVITLSGAVLSAELDALLRAAAGAEGVRRVENRLIMQETADAILKYSEGNTS